MMIQIETTLHVAVENSRIRVSSEPEPQRNARPLGHTLNDRLAIRRTRMSLGPFFTELDHRAAIKGSRDPLGIQPIWTRLGRHVVGNVTTVSDSLRDFTVLLIGLYLADREAGQSGAGADLGTFLRWEQLCAYARATVNNDWNFRGVEQVRKRLGKASTVVLSREEPILSDQKTYGLWGLYTMPARSSGLVRIDTNSLMPDAADFVEQKYARRFSEQGFKIDKVRALLAIDSRRLQLAGKDALLVETVASLLKREQMQPGEPHFYREHLLFGGPNDPTHGGQQRLANLLSNTLNDTAFVLSPVTIKKLANGASKAGDPKLAHHLDDIRIADALLGPMALLFPWLLGAHGQTIQRMATDLRKSWGPGLRTIDPVAFAALGDCLPTHNDLAESWVAVAHSAREGDYEALIRHLIAINARVMEARGGAAWISLQGNDIEVRFQEGPGRVPDPAAMQTALVFPYFIPSLRAIAKSLQNAA